MVFVLVQWTGLFINSWPVTNQKLFANLELEIANRCVWQVEELKADLADVKQMYREQITMLVGQVHCLTALVVPVAHFSPCRL